MSNNSMYDFIVDKAFENVKAIEKFEAKLKDVDGFVTNISYINTAVCADSSILNAIEEVLGEDECIFYEDIDEEGISTYILNIWNNKNTEFDIAWRTEGGSIGEILSNLPNEAVAFIEKEMNEAVFNISKKIIDRNLFNRVMKKQVDIHNCDCKKTNPI